MGIEYASTDEAVKGCDGILPILTPAREQQALARIRELERELAAEREAHRKNVAELFDTAQGLVDQAQKYLNLWIGKHSDGR